MIFFEFIAIAEALENLESPPSINLVKLNEEDFIVETFEININVAIYINVLLLL